MSMCLSPLTVVGITWSASITLIKINNKVDAFIKSKELYLKVLNLGVKEKLPQREEEEEKGKLDFSFDFLL